ncbi:hypothetical protein AVEN_158621-1 [Araneus ventricosus]|uniref:Uncharacterized protein n=1 Tax=Araneus ventricosus TaxID=182803 RepID=A0A4Y2I754_ARAVE|nr:hypothetical protein AVEN_158621-1 [Araneus ventricosus]
MILNYSREETSISFIRESENFLLREARNPCVILLNERLERRADSDRASTLLRFQGVFLLSAFFLSFVALYVGSNRENQEELSKPVNWHFVWRIIVNEWLLRQ